MKFLHVADLHIGKYLGDYSLLDDQKYILNQITDLAEEHKVDAVLVAGDVYDKSDPSAAAVSTLNQFLEALADKGIKAFIISGNHDSEERLDYGSSFFSTRGINISGGCNGQLRCEVMEDDYGPLHVWMMPFVKAAHVRQFHPEAEIADYDSAVRALLEAENINPEERNILVAHQFVISGADSPQLSGSEGLATQSVGTVEMIKSDCFDAFDYVALGHIHGAQAVGRAEIRYAGSPLKYSLSEADHDKSVSLVTIAGKGNVQIEAIPLKPMRDLRHIKGRMKTLLRSENVVNTGDFIYVTLTDEDAIPNAMDIIKSYYKYTVKLEYDNSHTKQLERVDAGSAPEAKSFPELIADFYRTVYGTEISEEELKIMKEVAEEARVDSK